MNLEKIFDFYDFDNLCGRNDIRITFNNNFPDVRFGDLDYGADLKSYSVKENLICHFIFLLLNNVADCNLILKKYNEKWIVNKDKSAKLYERLKLLQVNNTKTEYITVDKNSDIIRLFVEAALHYNSFFEFLLPAERMVIAVTDHMDIFISAKSEETLQKAEKILTGFNLKNSDSVFEFNKIQYNH